MKQHISTKQLSELSEKGNKKLRGWWNKNPQDQTMCLIEGKKNVLRFFKMIGQEYQFSHVEGTNCKQGTFLVTWSTPDNWDYFKRYKPIPLLSIGQMIEFLDEKWPEVSIGRNQSPGWHICDRDDRCTSSKDKEELCDALWEVCKEVLNEKEKDN